MMVHLKNLWQRRWVRGLVWTATTLFSIYVFFCAWWNWHGGRVWQEALANLERSGETLDFRKIAPETIPDEKNFCAIPTLKNLALAVDNDPAKGEPAALRERISAAGLPAGYGDLLRSRPAVNQASGPGRPVDLKAWVDWLRREGSLPVPPDNGDAPRELLGALSKHDTLIAELAAGLGRSEAQWTPHWRTRELPNTLFEIHLPHYNPTRELVSMLCLRATAAARAGDAAKAHESHLIALRTAGANLNDPLLISTLVAAAQTGQVCDAIWEACAARTGSAADFRALEEELSRLDFGTALLRAFRGEMAACNGAVQWFKRSRDPRMISLLEGGSSESGGLEWMAMKFSPGGWFDANAATIVQLEHDYIIKPLREGGLAMMLREQGEFERQLKRRKSDFKLDSILACLLLPAVQRVGNRTADAQSLVDRAITACVLERHRIDHGGYPDSLDELKRSDGRPLPRDIITGEPIGYRKTADGKYEISSSGFDRGVSARRRALEKEGPGGTTFFDDVIRRLWDYPEK